MMPSERVKLSIWVLKTFPVFRWQTSLLNEGIIFSLYYAIEADTTTATRFWGTLLMSHSMYWLTKLRFLTHGLWKFKSTRFVTQVRGPRYEPSFLSEVRNVWKMIRIMHILLKFSWRISQYDLPLGFYMP